ncbi:Cytochrome b-c1 complex subunit 2 mitochondrial [Schistosoma japonicum]|uniref:Ubiquinol-cytochrome-c reductase complex core protein 2, mitochondrial n=1 Tax=Schistosoma japonicum TaxID=6182 RepID=C1LGD4_SCHJA|nr:Cytochrome b-c1 complex subunit 2 mitochondrial [Schistosoma japonicum]CAX73762.1 Ubiquinol-cytochrome-c reductase complex core protein 2, mitochondrial precursor [Schistosoma japonicum]CAX73763.1 Ubiquinol-cytochrome-c reductase complex core protein 2, mitochondrial precursor [Schistosoma japonicum]
MNLPLYKMSCCPGLSAICVLRRGVYNAAASGLAAQRNDVLITQSAEGIKLVSLPQPSLGLGCARVALVVKSGPRCESSKNRGISHLMRRSFGISTPELTSVNLTRHLQQMGARVQCTTTREHMIYTVDVAPNFAVRAGYLLCSMASASCYYSWELNDIVYKLMRKDVDTLNRRNLSGLGMELLHEAAFGTSDSGCGLGYSLISPVDRIGSHLIDQINEYHSRAFVGEKCVLGIVHSRADVDGIDILKQVKSSINLNPPHLEASSDNHGFVGGEIRRDLIAASTVYAYLAWPSRGFWPVCDLIVCALNGSSNRIHYGGNASKSLLARTAIEGDIDTEAVAFHKVYSDHGLFGIAVAGSCPKTVGSRIKRIISVLRSANFTEENLKQAKQILRADLMFRYENPFHSLVDISTNLLSPTNQSVKPIEVVASVNKTDLKSFNDAINKIVTSNHAAFSLVGPNLGSIEPLHVLLKE